MRRESKSSHSRNFSVCSYDSSLSSGRQSALDRGTPLLITKAPYYVQQTHSVAIADLQWDNECLKKTSARLITAFREVKAQYQRKKGQIKRLRDIADYFALSAPASCRDSTLCIPEAAATPSTDIRIENAVLRKHVRELSKLLSELRLELYKKKQEFEKLMRWLARIGQDHLSRHLPHNFTVHAVSFEALVAIYVQIGYSCKGLTDSDRKKIPVVTLQESQKTELCCICLAHFEAGTLAKKLPRCGHLFHTHCIDEWLELRSSCPLCVGEVVV